MYFELRLELYKANKLHGVVGHHFRINMVSNSTYDRVRSFLYSPRTEYNRFLDSLPLAIEEETFKMVRYQEKKDSEHKNRK